MYASAPEEFYSTADRPVQWGFAHLADPDEFENWHQALCRRRWIIWIIHVSQPAQRGDAIPPFLTAPSIPKDAPSGPPGPAFHVQETAANRIAIVIEWDGKRIAFCRESYFLLALHLSAQLIDSTRVRFFRTVQGRPAPMPLTIPHPLAPSTHLFGISGGLPGRQALSTAT